MFVKVNDFKVDTYTFHLSHNLITWTDSDKPHSFFKWIDAESQWCIHCILQNVTAFMFTSIHPSKHILKCCDEQSCYISHFVFALLLFRTFPSLPPLISWRNYQISTCRPSMFHLIRSKQDTGGEDSNKNYLFLGYK